MIGVLKQKIIILISSLLEGEIDLDIIHKMTSSLDFNMMKERVHIVFTRFAQQLLENDGLSITDIPFVKID